MTTPTHAQTSRDVRYARNGEVHLAFEVIGDGPIDLVVVPGFASHLDAAWEEPALVEFHQSLASEARLILYDRRGQGLSDRPATAPSIEDNVADLRAVLDAAGSAQAVVLAVSQGGPTGIAFAAGEPARTAGLILYGTYARAAAGDDYPIGPTIDALIAFADGIANRWGTADGVALFAPSRVEDAAFRQWFARTLRSALSPSGAPTMLAARADLDERDRLDDIVAPTLIIHRDEDRLNTVEYGRYLARRLPHATYLELPGADHLWWLPQPADIADAVARFLADLVGRQG